MTPHSSTRVRTVGRIALLCALAWNAPTAWSMNLLEVYRAALQQDPAILGSRASASAERERVPQARAQLLPNITASYSRSDIDLNYKTPGVDQSYISDTRNLTLRQPLFRKYQWAQYQQAGFQVQSAEAGLEKDVQDLATRVAGAYFEALLADDQLALVLTQKDMFTTQLDAARKALVGGIGTRTDIDDTQARLDMVLAQELEARQNQEYTRNALQVMVNDPVDRLAGLDLARLPLLPPDPKNLDEWRVLAEENSPDYQFLKAQRGAAKSALDMARAGHYPTVDAVAQLGRSASESVNTIDKTYSTNSIGVQVSIPIFSGGSVNSAIRQAQGELDRVDQALEAKRRDIGLRAHKEFRNVTEGILKIRALEQAERSANQVVLSTQKSFRAGLRSRLDILNAEQQRASTQRDLARARYMYLVARIRLHALAGQATLERIEEMNGWLRAGQ